MQMPLQAMLLNRLRAAFNRKPGATFTPQIPQQQQRLYATKPQPSSLLDTVKSWWSGAKTSTSNQSQPTETKRSKIEISYKINNEEPQKIEIDPQEVRKKVISYFSAKSPEERFIEDFNGVLNGTKMKKVQSSYDFRISEEKTIFSNEDLERAKKFIDNNIQFINTMFKSNYYVGEGQTLPRGVRVHKYPDPIYHERALDIVMRRWFSYIKTGDLYHNAYNVTYDLTDLENIKNYLKLAKYIADKGGVLSSLYSYQKVYTEILMSHYWQLYEGDLSLIRFYPMNSYEESQAKIIKEIFQELDPLLMKLSNEHFRPHLFHAKKAREEMEKNPNEYRRKKNDEMDRRNPKRKETREKQDRQAYLEAKRKRKEIIWRWENKGWGMEFPSEELRRYWNNVDFIEEEFQEWLKDPNGFILRYDFFYGSPREYATRHQSKNQSRDQRQEQSQSESKQQVPKYEGKPIWDLLPGLTTSSSKMDIATAYRKFMLQNHPDKLPKNLPEKEKNSIVDKVKAVNDAWDAHKEQLKREAMKKATEEKKKTAKE